MTTLAPGWYARLTGHPFDHDAWRTAFKEPFDPIVTEYDGGESLLCSSEFAGVTDSTEAAERARVLIARLNGALSLWNGSQPLEFAGVVQVHDDGTATRIIHMELIESTIRIGGTATLTVLGPDGKPTAAPPPTKSEPQRWNELAAENDAFADLLDHFGRADNWFDIYKVIEIASEIAGSEQKLRGLLGEAGKDAKDLKRSANFYRHARETRPPRLLALGEARPILTQIVRAAVTRVSVAPKL